jgi:hypothetical protein
MPFVYTTGSPPYTFINVEQAVGRGCPNKPDDVKLVQLLLKKDLTSPQWAHMLADWPLTGVCDERTIAGIHFFQAFVRALGGAGAGVVDQRVDRAREAFGPVHHSVYTIIQLNTVFEHAYPIEFANLINGTGGVPTGKVVNSI